MKKVLLVLVASILFAGTSFSQVKFGVTAGLNVSNETVSSSGISMSPSYKAGFQAGVLADCGLTGNFSIIPELLFAQRGYKLDISGAGSSVVSTCTSNYLQLPINAAYKFDLGSDSKFLIFAGPYCGYALSAKTKIEATVAGIKSSTSEKATMGSASGEMNPLDFGVNLGVGYQYAKLFFKAQYNLGLANMSNEKDESNKNVNFAVTAGYLF